MESRRRPAPGEDDEDTEIDWVTYMHQVSLYLKGERDYALIDGPTGPLVYPAGHVYIHKALYALTDGGDNMALAQQVYGALYVASLALTCAVYRQAGGVPNWIVFLLPLSKRLHSIYVLRLFNDCWAVVAAQAAVLAYGANLNDLGTLMLSCAISVKMSALLYLPGALVMLFKRLGPLQTLLHISLLALHQAVLGSEFLLAHPRTYLLAAFDFGRAFLYKWTVNWHMVSEPTFLSRGFANTLLLGHLLALAAFGLGRWCRRDGGVFAVLGRGLRRPTLPTALAPVSADHVTTVLYTSNLIGMIFARSLHYQFYSWYAQQLPFLAWRTKYPLFIKVALMLSVEYAWNVYPSTVLSSSVLLASNALLLTGIWFGYAEGKPRVPLKSAE